ncbi:MAG: 6-phospho-beta-glucosidase, partial [Bacilli bacterium]
MSKQSLKIVVIGGGSSYTPELIDGFIMRKDAIKKLDIVLVDIEEGLEKVEINTALAQRMFTNNKLDWSISCTLDRQKALVGADFIITQLRVGGLDSRINDERIPLKHGMIGQETNGFGGFAKASRTIPVLLDIAKDIEAIAPNAWLINFTNPSGIVTECLLKYTKVKVVGLCNIPYGMTTEIAEFLKVKRDEVYIHFVGLNHYVYVDEIIYQGKSILQENLEELLDHEQHKPKNIDSVPWIKNEILELKVLPSSYQKYYYLTNDML